MTEVISPHTWQPDMDKMEAVLDNPYILITDKKISNIQEILPFTGADRSVRRKAADHR